MGCDVGSSTDSVGCDAGRGVPALWENAEARGDAKKGERDASPSTDSVGCDSGRGALLAEPEAAGGAVDGGDRAGGDSKRDGNRTFGNSGRGNRTAGRFAALLSEENGEARGGAVEDAKAEPGCGNSGRGKAGRFAALLSENGEAAGGAVKEAKLAAGAPASGAKDGAVDVVEVKGEGPGKAVEKLGPREAASCSAGAKRKRGAALLSENGTEAADGAVKEAKAAPGCDAGKVEKLAAAGAPVSDAKDGAVEVVEVKGEGAVKARFLSLLSLF